MITNNAMQLKAFIKKKAQEYNVSAQLEPLELFRLFYIDNTIYVI